MLKERLIKTKEFDKNILKPYVKILIKHREYFIEEHYAKTLHYLRETGYIEKDKNYHEKVMEGIIFHVYQDCLIVRVKFGKFDQDLEIDINDVTNGYWEIELL